MSRKPTVLICGAAGFIGSHATEELARCGYRVIGTGRGNLPSLDDGLATPFAQGDLHDRAFVDKLLRDTNPDKILFAAGPADVQRSIIDPAKDFADQVLPLSHVLASATKLPRTPGVLLISSAAVYGETQMLPVHETVAPAPISPYGFHKLAQENLLHEFHALYGMPVSIARAFSTFGPRLRRLAVWDIATRALKGQDFSLRGTGQETRDYLCANDVSAAIACVIQHAPFQGEVINLASGEETRIQDLAACIYAALDIDTPATFDGQVLPGSPTRWRADTGRLRELGFRRQVDLSTGVARTVDWIRKHA